MIKFNQVEYEINGKKILHDINFTIENGESVTIAGPSGSGKSTILKLAAKIISPTKGEVIFDGNNIAGMKSSEYRQKVSYCFQQPVLFGEVVSDSFEFVYELHNSSYDEKHVLENLAKLDLKPEILKQKIQDLSGGEKQRVALARNTLFLPDVLLLDEVTTGLDATTKSLILQWLADLNKNENVTLIKVTHEEDEISSSERILYVKEGSLTENAN